MKEEIKKYKEEIREQEKAKREIELKQDMKLKIEENKAKMQFEVENAKKQINDYKLSKFVMILNSTLLKKQRILKGQMFHAITRYCQYLRFKEEKLLKLKNYQMKGVFFHVWNQKLIKIRRQREIEEFERE